MTFDFIRIHFTAFLNAIKTIFSGKSSPVLGKFVHILFAIYTFPILSENSTHLDSHLSMLFLFLLFAWNISEITLRYKSTLYEMECIHCKTGSKLCYNCVSSLSVHCVQSGNAEKVLSLCTAVQVHTD